MTDSLQSHHLVALERYWETRTILDRLIRETASAIRVERKQTDRAGDPEWEQLAWNTQQPSSWSSFAPASDTELEEVWLEFKFTPWEPLDGQLLFGAGLVVTNGLDMPLAGLREALLERGFQAIQQDQKDHQRFFRFKHPAELLAGVTIDEQVAALLEWVRTAFADTEDAIRETLRRVGPADDGG